MFPFSDTHCHLTLPQFDLDRSEVIQRAIDTGLIKLLIPGLDLDSSNEAIKLCAIYPGILYSAIGVHPNTKSGFSREAVEELSSLSDNNCVVAIGEIGLDYYRMVNSIPEQQEIYKQQLNLASELNLPVCIHNRNATDDILSITESWIESKKQSRSISPLNGVFHSFNGSIETAKKIIQLGFMLGISGPITYPKNHEFANVIREVGINQIVVETDAPYLAPLPVRGKRNSPENVTHVIEKLSAIFKLPFEKVCQITNDNADRLFHWVDK